MNFSVFPANQSAPMVPAPSTGSASGMYSFSLRDTPRVLKASALPFLILSIAALLGSFAYLRSADPSYSIISEIVIERKKLAVAQDETSESVRFNATQAEILKSPRIVRAALDDKPLPPAQSAKAKESNLSEVMWVMENLIVSPITGTQVIAISYETSNAEHGVALLDSIVDRYLSLSRGSDMEIQEETLEILQTSASTLREKLSSLERQYLQLRQSNNSLGEGDEALSLYRQIAEDYNSQRIRADREVSRLQARLANIRRANTTDEVLALSEDFVTGSTGRAVARSRVEITQLLTRFTEGHPDLVAARNNLNELESKLREEANKRANNVASLLQDARNEAARLLNAYEESVDNAKDIGVQRLSADSLRAEIQSTKDLLAEATSRINDRLISIGSLAGGRSGTVASVIRAPEVPLEASWPRPKLVYALALVFAAALAVLIGLLQIFRENLRVEGRLSIDQRGPSASDIMRESARRRVAE